jgi:hypothetical protein
MTPGGQSQYHWPAGLPADARSNVFKSELSLTITRAKAGRCSINTAAGQARQSKSGLAGARWNAGHVCNANKRVEYSSAHSTATYTGEACLDNQIWRGTVTYRITPAMACNEDDDDTHLQAAAPLVHAQPLGVSTLVLVISIPTFRITARQPECVAATALQVGGCTGVGSRDVQGMLLTKQTSWPGTTGPRNPHAVLRMALV